MKRKFNQNKLVDLLCVSSILLTPFVITSCSSATQDVNPGENPDTPPIDQPITPPAEEPINIYSYDPHIYKKMPVIRINTVDGTNFAEEHKDTYVYHTDQSGLGWYQFQKQEFDYHDATISLENFDENFKIEDLSAQVKIRGNTTTAYDKKPLKIKFTEKQSMFHLNHDYLSKDWVLLANWRDVSMLRNNLGLYLGQILYKNTGLYGSDFVNVEVYINNEYWGVYLLCEQNEIASGRVDIDEASTDYKGTDIGYLLEFDCYSKYEPTLNQITINYNNRAPLSPDENPNKNIFVTVSTYEYSIKSKIYTEEQRKFIQDYLENIYRICYKAIIDKECWEFNEDKTGIVLSKTVTDPEIALENVLDIDSAASVLILQEIACDQDVDQSSFFMSIDCSKTGDGKLKFQAPWDFDMAFGIVKPYENANTNNLYAANSNNPWLVLLYKSNKIKEKIKEKWLGMNENKVLDKMLEYIDTVSNLYVDNYQRNYEKWHNIGPYIEEKINQFKQENNKNLNETCSWDDCYYILVPEGSWQCKTQKEATVFLKKWLTDRFKVLDSFWLTTTTNK